MIDSALKYYICIMPSLNPDQFITLNPEEPVLDVRSPGEYQRGHIPGAVSFPLFSDAERANIGTLYKQEGRDKAVLEGLKIVGPHMAEMVENANRISPSRTLKIHCWRGGMRSESVGWLLEKAGFNVSLLKGGYKRYRHFVQENLGLPIKMIVLSGPTGSGKTHVLEALKNAGQQVIDLEALVNHKGSAFGALGQQQQPAIEQFENNLYKVIAGLDLSKPVWIEDESRKIGTVYLLDGLWKSMSEAPIISIEIPLTERLDFLVAEYGTFDVEQLRESVLKIEKRLGGQHVNACMEALDAGNFHKVAEITLQYYDKAYRFSRQQKEKQIIESLNFEKIDPELIARNLIEFINHNNSTIK